MQKYEYIRLEFDPGDLEQLNRYSQDGWKVSCVFLGNNMAYNPNIDLIHEIPVYWALLERPTP